MPAATASRVDVMDGAVCFGEPWNGDGAAGMTDVELWGELTG